MEKDTHYDTVSVAIDNLRQQGFSIDFNLHGNPIVCNSEKLGAGDFEIVDTYRYEGNTDSADEATVYAIQSKSGLKGILVTGYGVYSDTVSTEILNKLPF
jgi:hypothetical protein